MQCVLDNSPFIACVMECVRTLFPRFWDMMSYPGAALRAGGGEGAGLFHSTTMLVGGVN
jgi:hypothetical protein